LGKAIDIKISTVVAISAILHQTDPSLIDLAMRDMTGGEADFFEDELAVLDIGNIGESGSTDQPIDWPALITLFRRYRLHLVAVRNAPSELEAAIHAHGLTLDRSPKPRTVAPTTLPIAAPVAVAIPASAPLVTGTMIIDTPVRAGQRIYARGCDLIITAAVNNGAEVIADGNIHIYAPLRGRALAGASGNADARIFTALMEAELVSIAGIYRTFDAGYPEGLAQRAVQIRLVGDRLDVHCVNP
jgi:septum site-determining protein MinC